MSRWQWLMSRLGRQLWVRTSAIGVMGILIAVLSAVIEPYRRGSCRAKSAARRWTAC